MQVPADSHSSPAHGDASDEDTTHRLTANAMHAKRAVRPVGLHHAPHQHEHHHIYRTGGGHAADGDRPMCRASDIFSQNGSLPGDWVPHADPDWTGHYVPHKECPDFAGDFDCTVGAGEVYHRNKDLVKTEFNKVFKPHKCAPVPHASSWPISQSCGSIA